MWDVFASVWIEHASNWLLWDHFFLKFRDRVWLYTFWANRQDRCHLGRRLQVLRLAGSWASPVCMYMQAQSHFPFANSQLSSNNNLWWDLSPEAVNLPGGSRFWNQPSVQLFFKGRLLGKSHLEGHSRTASNRGFFISEHPHPSPIQTWVWAARNGSGEIALCKAPGFPHRGPATRLLLGRQLNSACYCLSKILMSALLIAVEDMVCANNLM